MEKYLLTFSKRAQKDAKLLAEEKQYDKAKETLEILERNPLQNRHSTRISAES